MNVSAWATSVGRPCRRCSAAASSSVAIPPGMSSRRRASRPWNSRATAAQCGSSMAVHPGPGGVEERRRPVEVDVAPPEADGDLHLGRRHREAVAGLLGPLQCLLGEVELGRDQLERVLGVDGGHLEPGPRPGLEPVGVAQQLVGPHQGLGAGGRVDPAEHQVLEQRGRPPDVGRVEQAAQHRAERRQLGHEALDGRRLARSRGPPRRARPPASRTRWPAARCASGRRRRPSRAAAWARTGCSRR